jgi:hypothetical protein
VPQGSILGPLFFLIYINDLPTVINKDNNIVLFADDTSIIITDTNKDDFKLQADKLFTNTNTRFNNNLLNLNFSKTHCLEFSSTKHYRVNMQIQHNHNYITNTSETKFLGLIIDDTLSWKQHIEQLTKKMSSACYALRYVKYSLPIGTLKIIYFAHIHTIMSYSVIFWGNSCFAKKVFILQKKIIIIISNAGPRDSCREIFKSMQTMTLHSEYIYSILLFTVNNKHLFTANNEIHNYNTRNNNNLHPALANLAKFNKGPYTSGIKIFNRLPQYLKALVHNSKHFRSSLKISCIIILFTLWKNIMNIRKTHYETDILIVVLLFRSFIIHVICYF